MVGLADREKGLVALAGALGFLVMNATIATLLSIFDPEGKAIDAGVVGSPSCRNYCGLSSQ